MTKAELRAELESGTGVLGNTAEDEPVFLLVARDRTSSKTVRQWRQNAFDMGCQNAAKLAEANAVALAMAQWRDLHGGGKTPD